MVYLVVVLGVFAGLSIVVLNILVFLYSCVRRENV